MAKSPKEVPSYPLFERESWFAGVVSALRALFLDRTGHTVPERVNVSCASLNKRNTAKSTIRADGAELITSALPYILTDPTQSKSHTWEIVVNFAQDKPERIIPALLLALTEITRGISEKGRVPHDEAYTGYLEALGFQATEIKRGPKVVASYQPVDLFNMTSDRKHPSINPESDLSAKLAEVVKAAGPFPHASVDLAGGLASRSTTAREPRVTRLKVACQHNGCKYNAQVSTANLLIGLPLCGAHGEPMIPEAPGASASKLVADAYTETMGKLRKAGLVPEGESESKDAPPVELPAAA